MKGDRRALAHPLVVTFVLVACTVPVTLVVLRVGWARIAAEVDVATQLTYVASVSVGGLIVLALAVVLAQIQDRRRRAAEERAQWSRVIEAATEVVRAARGREGAHGA